jgi:hypothetical protein
MMAMTTKISINVKASRPSSVTTRDRTDDCFAVLNPFSRSDSICAHLSRWRIAQPRFLDQGLLQMELLQWIPSHRVPHVKLNSARLSRHFLVMDKLSRNGAVAMGIATDGTTGYCQHCSCICCNATPIRKQLRIVFPLLRIEPRPSSSTSAWRRVGKGANNTFACITINTW